LLSRPRKKIWEQIQEKNLVKIWGKILCDKKKIWDGAAELRNSDWSLEK